MIECGKMLEQGRPVKDDNGRISYQPYRIKVFNTIDFGKSMHYNPFAYISKKNREKDILKFVDVLIKNTQSSQQNGGDDFWVKAEKLLYTAYIAMIFTINSPAEQNFETLIEMINSSECREDDETFKNAMDRLFEFIECWISGEYPNDMEISDEFAYMKEHQPNDEQKRLGAFACKQYHAYKLAAGKTAKSILISCSTRLAPFAIDEVLEITSYDELELDKLGDELSALFVIISDTDATFNFLVAIMYSQLFNLLCTKADNSEGGKLKYHVRCLLDEFANIGEIPQFEKLIATIRSREISASIILQAKSQLKAIYKDNADTIEGNCDTVPFGSVTIYELCICIRFGFTKNLVLPEPEPPITRIFLFRAYFGLDGLPIVKPSVCVRMTLLSLSFKSMYGSISFCSPHTAEPYSVPCRNFFLLAALIFIMNFIATPTRIPIPRSIGLNDGMIWAKAVPRLVRAGSILSEMSLPSAVLKAKQMIFPA